MGWHELKRSFGRAYRDETSRAIAVFGALDRLAGSAHAAVGVPVAGAVVGGGVRHFEWSGYVGGCGGLGEDEACLATSDSAV